MEHESNLERIPKETISNVEPHNLSDLVTSSTIFGSDKIESNKSQLKDQFPRNSNPTTSTTLIHISQTPSSIPQNSPKKTTFHISPIDSNTPQTSPKNSTFHISSISSTTPKNSQNNSTLSSISQNKNTPFQHDVAPKNPNAKTRKPRRSASKKILFNYLTQKKPGDLCECQKHPTYITIGHHKPLMCRKCRGCKYRRDCGICPICRDMEKFCGPGFLRGSSCIKRKCRKPKINCHPCSRGECQKCTFCPCNTIFPQQYH